MSPHSSVSAAAKPVSDFLPRHISSPTTVCTSQLLSRHDAAAEQPLHTSKSTAAKEGELSQPPRTNHRCKRAQLSAAASTQQASTQQSKAARGQGPGQASSWNRRKSQALSPAALGGSLKRISPSPWGGRGTRGHCHAGLGRVLVTELHSRIVMDDSGSGRTPP